MMNFPQLPSEPIRPEAEQEEEEIWQPSWKCFCCQDTGQVMNHLVKLVIPDYDHWHDRIPICQSPGCNASSYWMLLGNNNLDTRLTSTICQQLDMYSRENWKLTVERKAINLRELAQKRSMPGTCDRTYNDNREIQQRKAEIEAITSEQWLAMKDEYQRGKKDEVS